MRRVTLLAMLLAAPAPALAHGPSDPRTLLPVAPPERCVMLRSGRDGRAYPGTCPANPQTRHLLPRDGRGARLPHGRDWFGTIVIISD